VEESNRDLFEDIFITLSRKGWESDR